MFSRRKKVPDGPDGPDGPDDLDDLDDLDDAVDPDDDAGAETLRPPLGPRDVAEVGDDGTARVDLGGLLVAPPEGVELRLQADQATGAVQSVMLAMEGSALELRVFAAPKSGGLWDEVRREIVAEATKQGGTASASDGPHGTELRLQVPVKTPEGKSGRQLTRIVGVEGPRWFLRGTYLGTAAAEPDPDGPLEQAFRDVVVVRGQQAMPPREALPLRLPPDARMPRPEPNGSA